ncbi:MAG: hypothetical protein JF619_26990, partial [Massilia sp.]|nr:hypothetical protein [Massilia sp.]
MPPRAAGQLGFLRRILRGAGGGGGSRQGRALLGQLALALLRFGIALRRFLRHAVGLRAQARLLLRLALGVQPGLALLGFRFFRGGAFERHVAQLAVGLDTCFGGRQDAGLGLAPRGGGVGRPLFQPLSVDRGVAQFLLGLHAHAQRLRGRPFGLRLGQRDGFAFLLDVREGTRFLERARLRGRARERGGQRDLVRPLALLRQFQRLAFRLRQLLGRLA